MQDMKLVLHDVEEEEKLFHLYHHSKKLAIAFGYCHIKNSWESHHSEGCQSISSL